MKISIIVRNYLESTLKAKIASKKKPTKLGLATKVCRYFSLFL